MRRKAPVNSNCKNCTFFKNAIISINYGMIGKKNKLERDSIEKGIPTRKGLNLERDTN